jgi:hypothetical protein
MWRIEFTSGAFLPREPEEQQVNPGLYGKELAMWLVQALAERGVAVGEPIGEDWGWLCIHTAEANNVWIGCGSLSEPGEGYSGKAIDWSIFVETKKRWFRKASDAPAQHIETAIRAALADKGIINVRDVEG